MMSRLRKSGNVSLLVMHLNINVKKGAHPFSLKNNLRIKLILAFLRTYRLDQESELLRHMEWTMMLEYVMELQVSIINVT